MEHSLSQPKRDKQIKSPLAIQVLWASARMQKNKNGSTDRDMLIGTIKYMEPVFANIIIFQHQEEVKRFVSSHLSVIWRKKEI